MSLMDVQKQNSLTRWLAVSENWQKRNTVCQNPTHLLPFGVISLHLILSLTFLFFTPTLRISSTTSSMNLLCGLPLFLWHGSSTLLVKTQNSDLGLHVWGICLGYFNYIKGKATHSPSNKEQIENGLWRMAEICATLVPTCWGKISLSNIKEILIIWVIKGASIFWYSYEPFSIYVILHRDLVLPL